MPVGMRRERDCVRLIKPTRNHAPTEYNLRYKRWPQHAGHVPKPVMAQNKRGKLVKAGRLWSSSKPRNPQAVTSGTTSYPKQTTDETSGKAATCGSGSFITRFSSDGLIAEPDNSGNLTTTLMTTPLQLQKRPHAPTPEHAVLCASDSEPEESKSCRLEIETPNEYKTWEMNSSPHVFVPPRPKKAWLTKDKEEKYQKALQDDISEKLRFLTVHVKKDDGDIGSPSFLSRKSAKTSHSEKSGTKSRTDESTRKDHRQAASPRDANHLNPTRTGSHDSLQGGDKGLSPEDSLKGWKHFFPEDDRDVPRLKSGGKALPISSKINVFKKKKFKLGEGIDEESLRKIYTEATDDELRRLKKTFRGILGSTHSKERVVQKQYASINDELPSDMSERPLSKDEFNNIRHAAFKASQKAAGPLNKDTWTTRYMADYCNKWPKDVWKDRQTAKNLAAKDEKNEKAEHEPEIKEHFKSRDMITREARKEDTSKEGQEEERQDGDGEKGGNSIKEESANLPEETDGTNSRTVDGASTEKKPNSDTQNKSPGSEEGVKLKEANDIEEREFRSIFRGDGKPKMKFETTFQQFFKGTPCRKPEDPVWAHKTVVSLGSGHWNVLWDHYDGWEVEGDANKTISNMVPKKDERKKYKIKVYEQGEPCPQKQSMDKDMVMGRYGGDGGTRKTHVNYMTEYMRKFTRMPLPRK